MTGESTTPDTPSTPAPGSTEDVEARSEVHSARPRVGAVRCPAGHPNPASADSCRTCGQPIVDHLVTEVERPVLGRLELADGAHIELDRPVLIGRKPPTEATIDGEAAHVLAMSAADSGLSRSHAEIRLAGWDVQVVDLDSVNHTYVTLPDEAPVQLRPNEPFTVAPGTVITLGATVRVTYDLEP